jgi:glycosyltransferase involved in cell wall biosynthesis
MQTVLAESRMRILHVVATRQRRGAEMFAADLIRALNHAGVSQRVIVLRGNGPILAPYEAPMKVLGADGWRAPGLRVDPRSLLALGRTIDRWSPSIIQAHGGEALKYSVLAGRRCRVVYRRIGSASPWITGGLHARAHGMLMRRAARVVTLADRFRRETIDVFRLPSDRVVTIPGGVDPRRLEPEKGRESVRLALGLPNGAPTVLFLGALTWEKDPLAHVDIAARLHRRLPDVLHLVVGDGPLRGVVEQRVRDLGLERNVLLLGSRSDVGDLLSASDLMLLPSRTEGMPGCLIEAGMSGLPTVAYAVGGVADVVVNGVTGLLAPPGDASSLEASTFEVLRDPAARDAISRAAREHCRSRFDIGSIAPMYLRLYDEVIAER